MRIIRDLWLCVDCTIVACNGDYSGIDFSYGKDADARIAEINAGFDRLGPISANWQPDDESGEITDGHRDFSACGCDCCGSRLAGEMHRFAILGDE